MSERVIILAGNADGMEAGLRDMPERILEASCEALWEDLCCVFCTATERYLICLELKRRGEV